MLGSLSIKNWLSWRLIQPYLCTIAVALSFSSTWRAPREAFRYGGFTSVMATSVASIVVALPAALLQLAVGQLSQQDAVGIWRAVPFFKGVGFTRLLISFIGALYTVVYIAICITYIFYVLSNSVTLLECSELLETPEGDIEIVYNASTCLNETFLAPVSDNPEYYIALAFIVIVIWILFPFILYNPVKLMKRLFYVFGFLVFSLGTIILSCVGDKGDLSMFLKSSDWIHFLQPQIWQSAIVQALISNQISGGFLISSGDSIYANTNIQWISLIFVGANVLAGWVGILFWFAVAGEGDKVTNNLAVIVQTYRVTVAKSLSTVWPILIFSMLSFSGMITMFTLLYPLYDRFRRVGGHKWRYLSVCSSVVGASGALTVLVLGHSALSLLEDVIIPCLVAIATVLEISAFVFIYGWKLLAEDIEFLIGSKLSKCWVWGWCTVPGIIVPFSLWWVVACFLTKTDWNEAPWEWAGIVTSAAISVVLFSVFATVAVAKQVQYDLIGKLKSSFRPSRHWGPRDPITHHYWLARREEGDQNVPRVRYHRRQLGQLSGIASFVSGLQNIREGTSFENKKRSNSDDILIVYRRNFVLNENNVCSRQRSKSLDWDTIFTIKLQSKYHNLLDSFTSEVPVSSEHEKNNNIATKDLV